MNFTKVQTCCNEKWQGGKVQTRHSWSHIKKSRCYDTFNDLQHQYKMKLNKQITYDKNAKQSKVNEGYQRRNQ